jgi:hypothetical protein
MVNNRWFIIQKVGYKKGSRGMTTISIKKIAPVTPKQVVNVFDLGYLGVEEDFPEQLSFIPNRKKLNILQLSHKQKKNTTKTILKK